MYYKLIGQGMSLILTGSIGRVPLLLTSPLLPRPIDMQLRFSLAVTLSMPADSFPRDLILSK